MGSYDGDLRYSRPTWEEATDQQRRNMLKYLLTMPCLCHVGYQHE